MRLGSKLISVLVAATIAGANLSAFSADMKAFRMTPYEKPELAFEIMLPSDWVVESDAHIDRQPYTTTVALGKVARYTHPAGAKNGFVDVEVLKIEHEISAKNWLKLHLKGLGNQPVDVKAINDKSANAFYVRKEKDTDYVGYVALRITGPWAELAFTEISAPADKGSTSPQQKSIDSFNLQGASP